MKRRALLIGYSGMDTRDGQLQGVSKDINNYKNHLLSLNGGAWEEDEITILEDTDIRTLENNITFIKAEKNDIVFTVFTGHGEYDSLNHCRNIYINAHTVRSEHILSNLAPKQIIILDSCSGERENERVVNERRSQIILESKHIDYKYIARRKYEEAVNKCLNQTLKFYAAEIGTYANDTSEGGLYSTELLHILRTNEDLNIHSAHEKADEKIRAYSNQKPDLNCPRLFNYLPGAIYV